MPHPLTARLAAEMWTADGRPTRDARGDRISIDTYEAWAETALRSLDAMFPGQLTALAATGQLDPHAGRPDWPTLPVTMCHEAGHVLGVDH